MATPLKSKPVQDVPPPGGFKPINVRFTPSKTYLKGRHLFALMAVTVGVGFYFVGQGNIERRHLEAEKRQRRAAIIPFLQAEEDVRYLRKKRRADLVEAEIMKDVPGWKVGENVYSTGAVMPPPGMRPV